ncbi:MAG TPA: hypothetical protein VK956_19010 [Verrucomicrobium sp.]|nr:hypothetical protein [Verrucomicrobium sp.]
MALPSLARLGETKDECDKRYGAPTEVTSREGTFSYTKNGIFVFAKFREEKCVSITYRNSQVTAKGEPKTFTSGEVDMLLAANEGGEVWKLSPPGNAAETQWETATPLGKVARLTSNRDVLILSTKAEELKAKAEKVEKEKERLKDF